MPCNSDYMLPTRQEMDAKHHEEQVKIKAELDRLTHENDLLREMVINLDQGGKLTATELKMVKRNQTAHRKEDLARLAKTLRELIAAARVAGDVWITNPTTFGRFEIALAYERLGRVVTADPSQPLEPQLGFDPDSL